MPMYKFFVGQTVEYTPVGEKTAGLYKIVRKMPKKEQAFDLKYLIKSEAEAYERNVLECQLIPPPKRLESRVSW
jgi:DNA-dependent RNA polymerase auxiliary subunit epsilon